MIVIKTIIFSVLITVCYSRLPDKVFCANQECNIPISKAKTLLSYSSPESDLLSYKGNSEAIISMKSAGTNSDLWYATINGKSGFVNARFLREIKVYTKDLVVMPVEVKPIVKPDKVQQPHEVFEGTTIYSPEPTPPADASKISTEQISQISENIPESVHNINLESMLKADAESSSLETDIDLVNDMSEEITNEKETPNDSLEKLDESSGTEINFKSKQDTLESISLVSEEVSGTTESVIKTYDKTLESISNPPPLEQKTSVKDVPLLVTETEPNISEQNAYLVSSTDKSIKDEPLLVTETELNISEQNAYIVSSTDKSIKDEPLLVTETEPNISEQNAYLVSSTDKSIKDEPLLVTETELNTSEQNAYLVSSTDKSEILQEVSSESLSVQENLPSIDNNLIQQNGSNTPKGNIATESDGTSTIEDHTSISIQNERAHTIELDNFSESSTISPNSDATTISPKLGTTVEPTIPAIETEYTTDTTLHESKPQTIPAADMNLLLQELQNMDTTTLKVPYVDATSEAAIKKDVAESVAVEGLLEIHTVSTTTEQSLIETNSNSEQSSELNTESTSSVEVLTTTETPVTETYISSTTESLIEEIFTSTTESPPVESESEGIFSNIYSTIADILPPSTEAPPEEIFNPDLVQAPESESSFTLTSYLFTMLNSVIGSKEQSNELYPSTGDTCFSEEYCDGEAHGQRNRFITFILTTATSVLLFTLGYYYIDNKRQDSKFIGTINKLQRELLFATKECEILKEELGTTKNKLNSIEDSSFGKDDMVQSLKEEIDEMKAQNDRLRKSLDDNEKLLRVSENTAGELQNTLSDVENTLSELWGERAQSEEQIAELNERIQVFEEELISVTRDRDNYQLKFASAESALDDYKKQKKILEDINHQLIEANNTIELQKHECVALKDALKQVKGGAQSNIDVTSLIDHTEIKAKLAKALEERETYKTQFEVEEKERSRLADELKVTQDSMRTTNQQATEALTRLDVLGKYFQERETELMKELSTKESLWLSKQGESASTVEKIELLQQEVQRFKEKCDTLTLELAEQESARRTAISEMETRAHSAWLEARQAKREADAAKDEAAALRRKLAAMHQADGAASPNRGVASPLEAVDGLPPALPLAFLPPPLLPPLPRPPPLGRLPSPHGPRYSERRYSPDRRYSPESRYSPARRYSPESRYSPETVRYSPSRRYSPRSRRSPYSPRSRRRSVERYESGRGSRGRNGPADTETEYNSDSPTRRPRRRYTTRSGASSVSGCSSESEK